MYEKKEQTGKDDKDLTLQMQWVSFIRLYVVNRQLLSNNYGIGVSGQWHFFKIYHYSIAVHCKDREMNANVTLLHAS